MFLIIFEDGEVKRADAVGEDDKQSADDGYIDLIDITDPSVPKRFISGAWSDIEDLV
jgi:hypothetical protein